MVGCVFFKKLNYYMLHNYVDIEWQEKTFPSEAKTLLALRRPLKTPSSNLKPGSLNGRHPSIWISASDGRILHLLTHLYPSKVRSLYMSDPARELPKESYSRARLAVRQCRQLGAPRWLGPSKNNFASMIWSVKSSIVVEVSVMRMNIGG